VSQQKLIEYHLTRLKDKMATVRLNALEQLLLLQAEELPDVLEMMAQDSDETIRTSAREHLTHYLRQQLQSEQPQVSSVILEKLGELHIWEPLREVYLTQTDEALRETIRQHLIPHYVSQLKDEVPSIRLEAIQWLEKLEAKEALPALQEVFNNERNGEVKKEAQRAGLTIYKSLRRI
jgi:HEAT repeat protein